MPLAAGTQLGPYEILARIGSGGMGEVYRARDTKLGRDVAIKVLPDALAHDAERMARFEREAHVLASLNHPNIAAIYGLEESKGVRAIVMELVEGATLAERIAHGPVPLEEALVIARQIAEGVEYAHEKGIVHRDLKPANVKLTAEGQVKVLDFGLAKAAEGAASVGDPSISPTLTLNSTRAGVILGTAAYMSPEQARGATVDKRADIWGFGAVLYEMLTGKRPFAGETVSDTLAAVLKTEPEWDAVPAGMRPLVRRCLEKNARQRLRDIGDARIAIEEQLRGEAGGPEIVSQHARTRVAPWAVAGIAITVSLLLGVALWRATRPASQPLIRLRLEVPELIEGTGVGAVLSPDGTRVVYTGVGTDGKWRLYTRALNQELSTPMVDTEAADAPFFSPDGQYVGFFAGGKLKKVSVQGGGAAVLCDAPEGRGASWGDDGNIIAALKPADALSRVPSGGGTVQYVTELKPEKKDVTHRWPQVLPGAQAVLFTAHSVTGDYDRATIEVQSLRNGQRKTLVRVGYFGRYIRSGHLLYVRQGVLYAAPMNLKLLELTGPPVPILENVANNRNKGSAQVDVTQSGTLVYQPAKPASQRLMWLDSSGRMQPLPAVAAQYFGEPRFSPDGKRLAVSIMRDDNADVWIYDWERDTMNRLTLAPGFNAFPVWSPDGKHIVFTSSRHGGAPNLYWMRADGAGEAVRLTESRNDQHATSLSPDGKRLAFTEANPNARVEIWTLPLEEVESDHPKVGKPEPFLDAPFGQRNAVISPDGHWLAYYSDESGNNEVYVRRFLGPGGKWRVSTGSGDSAVWSRKKQELFYGGPEGVMVASYTVKEGEFVASKPKLWAAQKDLGPFDLSPDGQRFVVSQEETSERNTPKQLMFLLNFSDELRRRAPAGGK
jgi:Tol biopolymer transport system component